MEHNQPGWPQKTLATAVLAALCGGAYATGVPVITATTAMQPDGRNQIDMTVIDPDSHVVSYGRSGYTVTWLAIGRADPINNVLGFVDSNARYTPDTTTPVTTHMCSLDGSFMLWSGYNASFPNGNCYSGGLNSGGPSDIYDIYVYATNAIGDSQKVKVGTFNYVLTPPLISSSGLPAKKINLATFPSSGTFTGSFSFGPLMAGTTYMSGIFEYGQSISAPYAMSYYGVTKVTNATPANGDFTITWPVWRNGSYNGESYGGYYDLDYNGGQKNFIKTWGVVSGTTAYNLKVQNNIEVLFDLEPPTFVSKTFDPVAGTYAIVGNDTINAARPAEWGVASVGLNLIKNSDGSPYSITQNQLATASGGQKGVLNLSSVPDGYYKADAVIVDKFGNSTTQSVETNLEVANKVAFLTKSGSAFASGSIANFSQLLLSLSEVADPLTLSARLKGGPDQVDTPILTTKVGQSYQLAQPLIMPSASGNDYTLTVNVKTKNGISKTYNFPLQYAPPQIGVDPSLGVSAVLVPAISTPVTTSKGIPSFSTDTFGISGSADVIVRWTGNLPVVIGGQTLASGDTATFNAYSFSATNGKFQATIAPTKDGDVLNGRLVVMTNSSAAPVMVSNVIGLTKPSITLQPDSGMPSSPFYVLIGANRVAFNVVPTGNTQAGMIRVEALDENSATILNSTIPSGNGVQIKVNGAGIYSTHSVSLNVSYEIFPSFIQSQASSYTVLGKFGDITVNPVVTTSAAPSTDLSGTVSAKGSQPPSFDVSVLGRQAARFIVKDAHNGMVATADLGEISSVNLTKAIGPISPGIYTVYLESELLDANGGLTGIKQASSTATLNAAGAVGLDQSITEGKVLLPIMPIAAKHSSGNWPFTSTVLKDGNLNPASGIADLDITVDIGAGSVTIAGNTVTGQATFTVPAYDFSANNGKVSLPIIANNEFSGRIKVFAHGMPVPGVDVAISGVDVSNSVSLAASQASYAANVEQVKITPKASGSLCPGKLFMAPAGSPIAGTGCAIMVGTLPDGLTADASGIAGFATASGTKTIGFDIGWVQQGVFTPIATNKSMSVDFIDPVAPAVDFAPASSALNGSQLIAKADGNPIGTASASTSYMSAETVVEVSADTGDTGNGSGIGKTPAQAAIKLNPLTNLGVVQIKVKGYYKKAPNISAEKSYSAIIIGKFPAIAIDTNTPITNVNNVVIVGNYGFKDQNGSYSFDPVAMGRHRITASLVDRLGKVYAMVPAFEPNNSTLSLPLGNLSPGEFMLKINDDLLDTSGSQVLTSVQGVYAIRVVNGAAIDASLSSLTGTVVSVPSVTILSAVLQEKARVGEIGQTEWVESIDGVTYSPISDPAAVKQLTSLKTAVQATGKRYYKAKIKNKYSGIVSETSPIEVEGLVKPKPKISSQAYVLTGTPITLNVSDEAGQTTNFIWYVVDGKEIKRYEGSSITVTPSSNSNLAFMVKAVLPGASESDTQRTTTAYGLSRVVGYIFEPFTYTVPGYTQPPRLLEIGKPYTFTMKRPKLMGVADMTNYPLDTKWLSAGGATTPGEEITFTPKAGDYKVSYQASLVNQPKVMAMVNHYFSTYTYKWPEFSLTAQVQSNTAPTVVYMQVKPKDPAMATIFKQETPTYTWNLPEGMVKVQGRDDVMIAQINHGGTYTPTVTVSDKRGNSTELVTQPITIAQATLLDTAVTAQIQDPWKRAPTKVFVNVSVKQIGKGDKVDRYDVYLDDSLVVTTKALPISFTANQPYSGTLKVVTTSLGGATDTKVFPVEFISPPSPVCSISSQGSQATFILLQANCTVQNGKIAGYKWTSNGTLVGTSSFYNIPATVLRTNPLPTYQVTAETDLHTTGSASITP